MTTRQPTWPDRVLTALAWASVGMLIMLGVFFYAAATTPPAHADGLTLSVCMRARHYSDWRHDCRAAGWTVRPRIVVNPHRVVKWTSLPDCIQEDGSGQHGCIRWQHSPDGRSYWVDPSRTEPHNIRYVRSLS